MELHYGTIKLKGHRQYRTEHERSRSNIPYFNLGRFTYFHQRGRRRGQVAAIVSRSLLRLWQFEFNYRVNLITTGGVPATYPPLGV